MVTDQMIEDLFHYDNNEYFLHYINQKKKQRAIKGVSNDESGKTATTFIDGSTETLFANGVKKEVFPNGYCIVHFNNKDVKQVFGVLCRNYQTGLLCTTSRTRTWTRLPSPPT